MKTIIIVGASSGIGHSIALLVKKEVYKIYNISRSKCDIPYVINISCDVSNSNEFETVLNEIFDQEPCIDIGIYCSGYSIAAPVELGDYAKVSYLYSVNYLGAVLFCKQLAPIMKKQNYGKIALVGSMAGVVPIPYMSFYSGSKAALAMLSYAVGQELKRFNVKCTCIMPGGTATSFTKNRDKVDSTNTVYESSYNKFIFNITKEEQEGDSAEFVARKIIKIISKKNPPLVVPIGGKNKLTYILIKLMPIKFTNKLVSIKFKTKI